MKSFDDEWLEAIAIALDDWNMLNDEHPDRFEEATETRREDLAPSTKYRSHSGSTRAIEYSPKVTS